MNRWLVSVPLLTLVYLFALASFDPVDAVIGVAVAAAAVALSTRLDGAAPDDRAAALPRRLLSAVPVAAAVLRDILVGTWQVALIVLHLRPLRSPGIVAIPIGERSSAAVAVTAFLATLAPGEFLVDVDWDRGVILMHVIDARDPDALRLRYAEFYERYERNVVP